MKSRKHPFSNEKICDTMVKTAKRGTDMEIRRARPEDLPKLSLLLYQVAAVHHVGRPDIFKANSKKYTDEMLLELLKEESRPIFVGLIEGEVVCHLYCIIQEVKNSPCLVSHKTLYIDDLCVEQSRRGQKIGQQMYAFIKNWAKEQGFYNITLNVWACNPSAQRFYEKLGMKVQKTAMEEIL